MEKKHLKSNSVLHSKQQINAGSGGGIKTAGNNNNKIKRSNNNTLSNLKLQLSDQTKLQQALTSPSNYKYQTVYIKNVSNLKVNAANTNANNLETKQAPPVPTLMMGANGAPPPNSSSPKLTNIAVARIKNEEAINDLRHRIPEIENVFDLHSRIGNGTFSTVLLATLKKQRAIPDEMRRKFAIKHHIPTSHPERIMKELQCMVKIGGQDNVAGINCCMRCNESVAFIMPYMPHDRFHDFYNKMDLAEIQFYMKNLLIALRRVHKFNVIHRDVKPSNFLYNRNKREFLLVDFGLAQQAPMPAKSTTIDVDVGGGCGGGSGNNNINNRIPAGHDCKRTRDPEELGRSVQNSEASGSLTSNGGSDSVISGVSKRLRCTGPNGDQQVAGPGNNSFILNNEIGGGAGVGGSNSGNNQQFKMPLKQVNENSALNKIQNCVTGGSAFSTTQGAFQASAAIDTNSKYVTNRNLISANTSKCYCYGNPQVCNICLIQKEIHASRAGTPGYRPPEVLLKYPDQTTAVDMWAAGVIFLSILSHVYPFFKAPNDFVALAEIVTVFGDKAIRKTAFMLDRLLTLSQRTKPIDLRKLCIRFRNRAKHGAQDLVKSHHSVDGKCEVCKNCDQYYFNCICLDSTYKTDTIESEDIFPPSTYDLLHKLLEVNPYHRITAEEALKHPFFKEVDQNGGDHQRQTTL